MRLFQAFDEIEDMMAKGRRLVVSAGESGNGAGYAGSAVAVTDSGAELRFTPEGRMPSDSWLDAGY